MAAGRCTTKRRAGSTNSTRQSQIIVNPKKPQSESFKQTDHSIMQYSISLLAVPLGTSLLLVLVRLVVFLYRRLYPIKNPQSSRHSASNYYNRRSYQRKLSAISNNLLLKELLKWFISGGSPFQDLSSFSRKVCFAKGQASFDSCGSNYT